MLGTILTWLYVSYVPGSIIDVAAPPCNMLCHGTEKVAHNEEESAVRGPVEGR
jgi:hypothetical protein